jgi:DNA invertase Pin-like site-specific DNA recombinase
VTVQAGTKPIWLYLRRSSFHDDGGDAIERHRVDLTRNLAADGGWTVMGEYVDNDSASKTAVRTRRGWHQLQGEIDDGTVKAVAIWKLDRANRVAWKNLEWLARCAELGVKVVSFSDPEMATQDSSTKILVALKSALAEVETDMMSTRQLSAKAHAAEAGFNHGGMRPIGWMPSPQRETDEHGRSGFRMIPHPVEFPAVQDAIAMCLAGHGLHAIAVHWAEFHGITTAAGQPVYEASLWRLLRSPHLLGYRRYRAPTWQKRGDDRATTDPLAHVARGPDGQPVVAHEPACDMATFLQLQRVLSERRTATSRRPWGTHPWLLTGLVFCGDCGERIYGRQKVSRNRWKSYAYVCTANRRLGPGTCGGLSISAEPVEDFVVGWLFGYVTDDRLCVAIERNRESIAGKADPVAVKLALAREERATLLRQQQEGTYRGSMIQHFLRLIDEVETSIESLERMSGRGNPSVTMISSNRELVANWPRWSLDQRRHALRSAISRIVVTQGRLPIDQRLEIIPRL